MVSVVSALAVKSGAMIHFQQPANWNFIFRNKVIASSFTMRGSISQE
jgi:hypothetical protein